MVANCPHLLPSVAVDVGVVAADDYEFGDNVDAKCWV